LVESSLFPSLRCYDCPNISFLAILFFALIFLPHHLPFLGLLFLSINLPEFRTGVLEDLNITNIEIAHPNHVNFAVNSVAASSHVAIERNLNII